MRLAFFTDEFLFSKNFWLAINQLLPVNFPLHDYPLLTIPLQKLKANAKRSFPTSQKKNGKKWQENSY